MSEFDDRSASLEDDRVDDDDNDDDGGGSVRPYLYEPMAEDTFKARLDRFWSDQNVKYNWKSDIITGSRSQVSVIIE